MTALARSASLFAGAALSLALSACGQGAELDGDELPLASELQADSASLQWARPSQFAPRCEALPCPVRVMQVLGSSTSRPVYRLDLRALPLSGPAQEGAGAQAGELLLYGRFVTARISGRSLPVFQAVRGYRSFSSQASDDPAADRYFSLAPSAVACIRQPCPTLAARSLSQPTAAPLLLNGVDLAALQLPLAAQRRLEGDLGAGTGIVSVDRIEGGVAHVTQAFRAVDARPLQ